MPPAFAGATAWSECESKKLSIGSSIIRYTALECFGLRVHVPRLIQRDTLGLQGKRPFGCDQAHRCSKGLEDLHFFSRGAIAARGALNLLEVALISRYEQSKKNACFASTRQRSNTQARVYFLDDFGERDAPGTTAAINWSRIVGSSALRVYCPGEQYRNRGRDRRASRTASLVIWRDADSVGNHFTASQFTDQRYGFQKRRSLSDLFVLTTDGRNARG